MENIVKDGLKLGFGLMRLPRLGAGSEKDPFDMEQTKAMVDRFIAAGGKYFDTAYVYTGSEEATKEALCDRYPRDSYYLASKHGENLLANSHIVNLINVARTIKEKAEYGT